MILLLQKEVQKLALDARDKKEALLQVQSQVKDAESLAEATKQEAERLNKEAEDAQMAAASAASVQDRSPPPAANGYANKAVAPPSYGMGPPVHATGLPSYEIASKPPTPGGGFGGPPIGGFDAHVMGSGVGISIPTPSEPEDPYVNPFQF